jgi:glycosyltransferase involved in cell wall biosynthesis
MDKHSVSWKQFHVRINQLGELNGFLSAESEEITVKKSSSYLVDSNIKAFSFWIAYFGRYPNYEEWEAVKTFIQVDSNIDRVMNYFGRIQKEPINEKVNLQFARGISINLQGIKLSGEISGIPFVARQVVEKLLAEDIKLTRLEVSENIEISEIIGFKQNVLNDKFKRNNRVKNVIFSGLFASARELNYSYPSFYKILKKVKNSGSVESIFKRQKKNQNLKTIVIPLNMTLVSITPILDEKQTALLSMLSELKLIRFIPIIHDVLPIKHSEFFPHGSAEGTLRYIKLCGISGTNFAVSNHTIRELEKTYEFLEIDSPKIELLDLTEFVPFRKQIFPWETPNEKKQYLLCISTFEPRKNHLKIVLVFERIKKVFPDLQLILVGNYGWKNEIIHKVITNSDYPQDIIIRRNIPEKTKYELIQNSLATVYMSKLEGFGLPVLESIVSGKYVIHDPSEPLSSFIKYGYSILVDCNDVDSIYMGVLHALTQEQLINDVKFTEVNGTTFQSFINHVASSWDEFKND